MNPIVRSLWTTGSKVPRVVRVQMRASAWLARNAPGLYVRMVMREFSDVGRTDYTRLGIAGLLREDRSEGYRQQGIGTWYDVLVPTAWPEPLSEVTAKVQPWHGKQDNSAPVAMGQYLAESIPRGEATSIDGAGHFWIFEHLPEMLDALVTADT